jgi:hypothetical protein
MDRETILKHSKGIRINYQILPDFVEILADICEKKKHPEHLKGLTEIIQQPIIGQEVIYRILEEYEKEYHIIHLIDLKNNTTLNIW